MDSSVDMLYAVRFRDVFKIEDCEACRYYKDCDNHSYCSDGAAAPNAVVISTTSEYQKQLNTKSLDAQLFRYFDKHFTYHNDDGPVASILKLNGSASEAIQELSSLSELRIRAGKIEAGDAVIVEFPDANRVRKYKSGNDTKRNLDYIDYIIFVAMESKTSDPDGIVLAKAYRSVVECANSIRKKSIESMELLVALPLLGSGNYGFDYRESLHAFRSALSGRNIAGEVFFNVYYNDIKDRQKYIDFDIKKYFEEVYRNAQRDNWYKSPAELLLNRSYKSNGVVYDNEIEERLMFDTYNESLRMRSDNELLIDDYESISRFSDFVKRQTIVSFDEKESISSILQDLYNKYLKNYERKRGKNSKGYGVDSLATQMGYQVSSGANIHKALNGEDKIPPRELLILLPLLFESDIPTINGLLVKAGEEPLDVDYDKDMFVFNYVYLNKYEDVSIKLSSLRDLIGRPSRKKVEKENERADYHLGRE